MTREPEYRMPEAVRLRNARLALAAAQSEFEAAVVAYTLAERAALEEEANKRVGA